MIKDKILNSSGNAKTGFSIAFLFVLGLACYNWVFAPQVKCLRAAQGHGQLNKSAKLKTKTIRTKINKKTARIEELTEQIESVKENFFSQDHAEKFMTSLDIIARHYGCFVEHLNFTDEQQLDFSGEDIEFQVSARSVNASFSGSYATLSNLLNFFSEYPQRVSIGNLKISPDNILKRLECQVALTIYVDQGSRQSSGQE